MSVCSPYFHLAFYVLMLTMETVVSFTACSSGQIFFFRQFVLQPAKTTVSIVLCLPVCNLTARGCDSLHPHVVFVF